MKYFRVIDANINRASEGLRILEEIFRFLYNNHSIVSEIKDIRHKVRFSVREFSILKYREVSTDVGRESFTESEQKRDSIENILLANFKRIQESFRVLEEFFKLENKEKSYFFKKLRFEIYNIEQKVFFIKKEFLKILHSDTSLLYGIVDSRFSNYDYIHLTDELIKSGIKIIQLRDKLLPDKELLNTAKKLSDLCKESNVLFIVNDRIDIAYFSDADGVHLGQDDLSINEAKELLSFDKIFGISTHNLQQVENAYKLNPDYIGFGPIFPTKSKENPDPVVGTEQLKIIKEKYHNFPVVAIGGINSTNINDVLTCNPEMVCVMSGIIGSENVYEEALKFRRIINDTIRVC